MLEYIYRAEHPCMPIFACFACHGYALLSRAYHRHEAQARRQSFPHTPRSEGRNSVIVGTVSASTRSILSPCADMPASCTAGSRAMSYGHNHRYTDSHGHVVLALGRKLSQEYSSDTVITVSRPSRRTPTRAPGCMISQLIE